MPTVGNESNQRTAILCSGSRPDQVAGRSLKPSLVRAAAAAGTAGREYSVAGLIGEAGDPVAGRRWLLSQRRHQSDPQLLIEILVGGSSTHTDDEQFPAGHDVEFAIQRAQGGHQIGGCGGDQGPSTRGCNERDQRTDRADLIVFGRRSPVDALR
jgi:hypothetical protein